MEIPPLDLKRQYVSIQKEIQEAVNHLFESQEFILGEGVEKFEKALQEYTGATYAIGVSSGTDAIQLALMALGIGAGDEVITTPFTFIATAEPVSLLGAVPVFADIDPKTFNLDPVQVEKKITAKTKAIIVVHLYGQVADMEPILKLAKKHGLKVIEDTAQAFGSTYGKTGEQAGTMGDIGALSFFPSKNLGGFGDGGAVLTNNKEFAVKIKQLRVHGQEQRYYHEAIGVNARLDALQAVILNVKLKYLPEWLRKRNLRARMYNESIEQRNLDKFILPPYVEHNNYHTYHQYVLRVNGNRDALLAFLQKAGIGARVYYPLPLHLQKCFQSLGLKKGSFPVSETAAEQIIALPIFPELQDVEQDYIVDKVAEFFNLL